MLFNLVKPFSFIIVFGIGINSFGQKDSTTIVIDSLNIQKDSISVNWYKVNKASLDINEVSFVNWSAGGTSSISVY